MKAIKRLTFENIAQRKRASETHTFLASSDPWESWAWEPPAGVVAWIHLHNAEFSSEESRRRLTFEALDFVLLREILAFSPPHKRN